MPAVMGASAFLLYEKGRTFGCPAAASAGGLSFTDACARLGSGYYHLREGRFAVTEQLDVTPPDMSTGSLEERRREFVQGLSLVIPPKTLITLLSELREEIGQASDSLSKQHEELSFDITKLKEGNAGR